MAQQRRPMHNIMQIIENMHTIMQIIVNKLVHYEYCNKYSQQQSLNETT